MSILSMLFVLVSAAVIQALLPAWGWFGLAKAPVLLGTVIYYAFTRERTPMLVAAVLAGVLQDALSLIPLGYSAALFCGVGLAVNRFRDSVFVFRLVTHCVVGGAAAGAVTALLAFLLSRNGLLELSFGWGMTKVTGAAMLGAIVVPVVFRAAEGLDVRLGLLEETA